MCWSPSIPDVSGWIYLKELPVCMGIYKQSYSRASESVLENRLGNTRQIEGCNLLRR